MSATQTAPGRVGEGAGPERTTYLRVWPVLDPDRLFRQLVVEAEVDLWDALIEQELRAVDEPVWRVAEDFDLPGAVDGLALTVRVAVVPLAGHGVPTDRDERLRRVQRLTTEGLSAAAIAVHLGCSKRQVERDRHDIEKEVA